MEDITKVIDEYNNKGYTFDKISMLRSGKEAVIYCVEVGGKLLALKVYKNPDERAFQKNEEYLEGKFYSRPSIRKAVLKGNRFAQKFLHGSWVKREYSLLRHLNKLGSAVPKVFDWTPTSILMEYLGNEKDSAPRLIDIELNQKDAAVAFQIVVETIKILFDAGVVHADLSAYNILWWQNKPYVIDFPQTIDIRHNPNVEKLLRRDVENVVKYFQKYLPIGIENVYQQITVPKR